MAKPTPLERYWAKIDTSGGPDACWPWTAGRDKDGYGIFHDGRSVRATRWGYRTLVGPIPDGHVIMHRCDRPECMRPGCWLTGTVADNNADRDAKGRGASGDRSGSRLHPERLRRGAEHPLVLNPGLCARGDRSGARLHPERLARGERDGNAKLTDDQVREMRRLREQGMVLREIGERFGVGISATHAVVTGLTWKHVA